MSADMNSPGAPGGAPLPPAVPPARRFLASDAERDQVAAILGGQYAEGRLTLDEYHERTAAVYAARTWGDLAEQVQDLPVRLPFLTSQGRAAAPGPAPLPGPLPYPGAFPGQARRPARQAGGRWDGDDTLIVILLCLVFPPGAIAYALLRSRGGSRTRDY